MMQLSRLLSAQTRKTLLKFPIIYSPFVQKVKMEITGSLYEAIVEIIHEDEAETNEDLKEESR